MPVGLDTNGRSTNIGHMGPAFTASVGSTTSQSAAVSSANCYAIRIVSTVDCYVAIGASPTATAASTRMLANQVEYYAASVGYKVATLRIGLLDGTMSITELI